MKYLALIICALCFVLKLGAQNEQTPSPIIFIYDASGSMWGQMQDQTKMEIAREVLSTAVDKFPENQKIGLVAYGHRKKGDCKDVEFLVDLEAGGGNNVKRSLQDIKPLGKTPLAYSAKQVIDKLRTSKTKATIILVTDGIESCDGNICDVISAANKEGIDFKLHIIGFGLKAAETDQLKCAAKAGGGAYYDAVDAGDLGDVLETATNKTIDDPEGNFSVYTIKNGAPIDASVHAYKVGTKEHVDGTRTYKDTSFLFLPSGKYDLTVAPLEGSDVSEVTIVVESIEGKFGHETISFDGGKIKVATFNNDEGCDAVVRVFDTKTGKRAAQTRTYGQMQELEINPGTYDVTFGALKMNGIAISHKIENVIVEAGKTINLEHRFLTGVARVGAKSNSGLVDAVVQIKELHSGENVAQSRTYVNESSNPKSFILNPGTYEVQLKALGDHKGKQQSFTMTVKEGETVEKLVNF